MAHPEPLIVHDGLAIYAFGEGLPILFTPYPHGASVVGDPTPTALITGLVRLGRRVITFDPPAAGRSTRPARLTMEEMLDGAEEALAVCGIAAPVDVLGHSQGALAALAFAIERRQRVRRLVLVGAAAGGPSYLHAPGAIWNRSHPAFLRFGMVAMLLAFTRRLAAQELMLNAVARASFVDPTHAAPRPIHPRDWLRPAESRIWWANVARHLDYRPRLGAVAVPALILVGKQDPQTPPACAEELTAGLPRGRLRVFPRSGHYPFIEEPEAFWQAVGAFLTPSAGTSKNGMPHARARAAPGRGRWVTAHHDSDGVGFGRRARPKPSHRLLYTV